MRLPRPSGSQRPLFCHFLGHCEERSDEAISLDCHALWARKDPFFVIAGNVATNLLRLPRPSGSQRHIRNRSLRTLRHVSS